MGASQARPDRSRPFHVGQPSSQPCGRNADDARPDLTPLAYRPVLCAVAALALLLTVTSNRYGYHRDELYFRMLRPAWGYVDQPPLAPLLTRAVSRLLADQPWAVRVPATLAAACSVLVVVLVTREFGGGRTAQALCAWGYASASLVLIIGHALLTATLDLPVWPAIVLFAVRAQLRREPKWWLAAGLVIGVSMYNKLLVAVLVAAVVAGVALVGPRALLRSRWVVGAGLLALAVGFPNLAYQASHHWPQIAVGQALARENASNVRVTMWPLLFLILGPPLVPIWVAGLAALARRPQWRPVRFLAAAFPVLLVLVFVMGAQVYYPFGFLAVLFAAGCVPTERWMLGWRWRLVASGVALNAAVSSVLGLPLIPLKALGATPVPGVNQVARDTVGWPAYVAEIAAAYRTLPTDRREEAVIVTSNYGEAGAVDRYGRRWGLPPVYSGLNDLYFQGPPPDSIDTVVFVGGQAPTAAHLFASCLRSAGLDNNVDVANEEQDEPIFLCQGPRGGWPVVWPALRHEG